MNNKESLTFTSHICCQLKSALQRLRGQQGITQSKLYLSTAMASSTDRASTAPFSGIIMFTFSSSGVSRWLFSVGNNHLKHEKVVSWWNKIHFWVSATAFWFYLDNPIFTFRLELRLLLLLIQKRLLDLGPGHFSSTWILLWFAFNRGELFIQKALVFFFPLQEFHPLLLLVILEKQNDVIFLQAKNIGSDII